MDSWIIFSSQKVAVNTALLVSTGVFCEDEAEAVKPEVSCIMCVDLVPTVYAYLRLLVILRSLTIHSSRPFIGRFRIPFLSDVDHSSSDMEYSHKNRGKASFPGRTVLVNPKHQDPKV